MNSQKKRFRFRLLPLLASSLAALLAAFAAADAGESDPVGGKLVGHRAIYKVTLASSDVASGITGATGAVLYRFTDACDGWTIENRTAIRLGMTEGGETLSDWVYASWESKNGKSFRFRVRDEQDGEITEELRGSASVESAQEGGAARFSQPEDLDVDLPPGTLFPTAHLLTLFRQARAGVKTGAETVFDGADLDNPYRVSAVVGPAPEASRRRLAEISGLGDLPVWAVRLAFFPVAESETTTPAFEVGIHYREDGIGDSIFQDFGNIVLKLQLQDVEILPPPDC